MFGINFISVFVRNVFGVSAVKARRARRMPALQIEGLESRQLLTASPEIAVLHVDSTQVEAGQDDVMLSKLKYGKGKWSPMEGMFFELADGTSDQALESVFIAADLKGRNGRSGKDGIPDTVLAFDGDLTDGWADLEFGRFGSLATKRVTLYVMGNMGENAPAGTTVGLKDPIIVPVNDSVFFDLVGDVNPVHTIRQQPGSLFVTQGLPVPSKYILAGTQSSAINFALTATGRDAPVTAITFAAPGNIQSIDRIYIYSDDQPTTPIGAATIAAVGSDPQLPGYTLYKAVLSPDSLDMTNGLSVHLTASPLLKNQDFGAVSSEKITLQVHRVEAEGFGANDGDANGNENEVIFGNFPGPNQTIAGPQHIVSFAKISSVTNANPDADGTNIPTGVRPIGVFKLTAASNSNTQNGLNKVMVHSASFLVTSGNMLLGSDVFRVFNMNDSSWKLNTDVVNLGNGTYRATINFPDASVVDRLIGSGESDTFAFEANVSNSKVNPALQSFLQVTLDTDSIVWSDPDALSTSTFTGLKLSDSQVSSTFYQS